MRIFVTGGTGFIGRHVVRELDNQGHKLLLLSRQPGSVLSSPKMPAVDIVQGDLADIDSWREAVKGFAPQVAIHLAWESLPDYNAGTSLKNLNYGLNLITVLAELGCETFLSTGSCWEYGEQSGSLSEDMTPKSTNAFTAAKNALYWLGKGFAEEHGMQFIWARLFYVYGPGQRETSLIPHLINSVRQGKMPEVMAPLNRNDFIYVEDVARAITALLRKPRTYDVYNIGSGGSTSVQEVVATVCDRLNYPCAGVEPNKQADKPVVDFWADISRIQQDFGWKAKVSINQGIEGVINSM